MCVWFVSTFWLWWLKLQSTFTCKDLIRSLFSILLGAYTPRSGTAGSYGCGNSVFTILRTNQTAFQEVAPFYFPPATYEGSNFSTFLLTVIFLVIMIIMIAVLLGAKW